LDIGSVTGVAALIAGFGLTVLLFRVQRELQVREEAIRRGEAPINWIPWADRLLLSAIVISVLAILVLLAFPSSKQALRVARAACAAALVVVPGYIPSILAHYRLIIGRKHTGLRDNPEPAEKAWVMAIVAGGFAVALYIGLR
jgi:hypothetical protein